MKYRKCTFSLIMTFILAAGGVPVAPFVEVVHAQAKELERYDKSWEGDLCLINDDLTIEGNVILKGDTTLTVAEDRTLKVLEGIECLGHTLTIAGPGNVEISNRMLGNGITGNYIQTGGTVKVTGGSYDSMTASAINGNVTLTGGKLIAIGPDSDQYNGGTGIEGDVTQSGGILETHGGKASNGSMGGYGVSGDILMTGGILTATGGDSDTYVGGEGLFSTVTLKGGIITVTGGNSLTDEGGDGIFGAVTLDGGIITSVQGKGATPGKAYNTNKGAIVEVTSGKTYTDDFGGIYSGRLTQEEAEQIAGRTIFPLTAGAFDYSGEKNLTVSLENSTYIYDGKTKKPKVTVEYDGILLEPKDYTVKYSGSRRTVGTVKVTVTGKKTYKGKKATAYFDITKADNTLNVTPKKKTIKASSLAKKAKTITVSGLVSVKKSRGKVSYSATSQTPGITYNEKNKKLTLPKDLAAGTYPVEVTVTAKGNSNYLSGSRTVTVDIIVK